MRGNKVRRKQANLQQGLLLLARVHLDKNIEDDGDHHGPEDLHRLGRWEVDWWW